MIDRDIEMTDITNYHYTRCDGVELDQQTGELRYGDTPRVYGPVGQLIAPKPISEFCPSFSLEIVNSGRSSLIGIGLCHKNYSRGNQPGWYANSIGYHADDGGIYDEQGFPGLTFGTIQQGAVMECSFDFSNNTVTFLRDGEQIYTSRSLTIPEDGFYPIIGLHSQGEVIRLLELDPWSLDVYVPWIGKEVVYHCLDSRGATVSQASGIVRFNKKSTEPETGQFVSKCPLSPDINKFSIEIVNLGEECCVSFGICHRLFPNKCEPGRLPHSIAYHIGDRAVYAGTDQPCHKKGPKVKVGDILTCEVDFASMSCVFKRNGAALYRSPSLTCPDGGFHAVVGFGLAGEAVCFLDKEPWRSQKDQKPQPKQIYHFSSCTGATLDQTTGTLSFVTGSGFGKLQSKCPLNKEEKSFSIEIKNNGKECDISIGLCRLRSPTSSPLGWDEDSIAYNVGKGRLHIGSSASSGSLGNLPNLPTGSVGDVFTCTLIDHFVSFFKNKERVRDVRLLTMPPEGLYAAVGLGSEFESVRLCEMEPWRKYETSPAMQTTEQLEDPRTMPKCCICMENGVSRFLIPCGHTFCVACISEWTSHHRTCPACRASYQEVKMLFY